MTPLFSPGACAGQTRRRAAPVTSDRAKLLAVAIALCAAATAVAQPAFTPAPSFSGPHPAVARIVVPERDGTAYGSGALVAVNESSGLVVTNWHVVRDAAGPITVWFPDGFRSGAYLLQTDRDWDLAALAIRRPNVQPVAIAGEAPRPGEELTIAGYGSGSYRAVRGRLTQYVSPGGNQPFEMIEMAAPARDGDSGGPIFNQRGELAGTLFGSAFGRTTGSYCGRVRWFLGSVAGDFQRISAQALLAQQSRSSAPPLAVINSADSHTAEGPGPINSPLSVGEGPGVRAASAQIAAQASSYSPTRSAATRMSPIPAAIPAPPAGPLPTTEHIRTILAAIGIIAVFYHALRLLGWAVG